MTKLKISVSERERNFCEDESHAIVDNHKEVVQVNDVEDQKPLDKTKLSDLVKQIGKSLIVIELGGLKLDNESIGIIANCGANIECIRIYDCIGLNDECLKLIGQRFGKTLKHIEILGFTSYHTIDGIKALLASIGNLEAIHFDSIIAILASLSGSITNLKHVWSKVSNQEKEALQQFSVKYAQYLRNLDITFSGTKSETPEYVALLANFPNLTKLSITATGDTPIDNQLSVIGDKCGHSLKELNVCVWSGGDTLLNSMSKFTNLETLCINGRSPMRHIDFKINSDLKPLSACTKLRHLRLILKNHSQNLYDNIDQYLPKLEVLEIVGLDITESAFKSIAKLKSLSFIDVASPQLTDEGMIHLIANCPTLVFVRPNGGEKVSPKTLDAIASSARKRSHQQIECVFNINAKIDLDARKPSLPSNLTVNIKESQFLLSFPGSTPRGF